MAEPIKSVLLVDFDSLHRSLTAAGGEAAGRLVTRVPGWLKGLESGRLLGPEGRTILVKRCYADPKAIGEGRLSFAAAGFDVVDCAALPAARGVDLLMAMDAMEHVADADPADEFILLSAEPTLAPLLSRLKRQGRSTAIYADTHTAQPYRALADAVLDSAAFAEFLLTHDAPEASSAMSVERSEIEALARRIHAATSIPLFSPRTFAELFRLLTEEIMTNGYHFQTTAKNVADKLSESGRSVTRRQVVFIVKGLALKGHVFSTSDSPRRLAEVFREQARYLIESAGVKLDDAQERILSAWLVDRVPTSVARAPAPMRPAAPANTNGAQAPMETPVAPAPVQRPAPQQAAKVEPLRPMPILRAGEKTPDRPAPVADKAPPPAPVREPPREAVPEGATPTPAAPSRAEPRAPGSMITPDDARAAIAAKIAQSRQRPGARPQTKPAASVTPQPGPAKAPPMADHDEPQSIENSILAAIAEAVDVLVEDGDDETEPAAAPATAPAQKQVAAPAQKRRIAAPATNGRPQIESRPPAERPQRDARNLPARPEPRRAEGEDIGDEIQRIIATYNRNRKDEPPGA